MLGRSLPLLVGVATVLVGAAFSWVPSLWWDEAATISAANRPLDGFVALHAQRDAVHALHNLLLHGWFSLVGIDEFTARIPGAVALGVGAAAVTATGRILAGPRVAVAAGVLFALTPRVTWAATEARSYAFAIAGAAVLSWLVAAAITSGHARWWVLYAPMVTLATVTFVYTATLVVAHAVTVLAARRDRLRFLVSAAVGSVAAAPFVFLVWSQKKQVSWIPPLDGTVVRTVLLDQWFPQAPWAAAMCAVIVVVGSVCVVASGVGARERILPWLAVPGVVVPMALLLAVSVVSENIYLDRYVAFTVPSMALSAGWMLARITARGWVVAAGLAAVAVAVAPAYVAQRQPFGKPGGSDYTAVADRLLEVSRPGDCLAFEPTVSWQPTSPRSVADARPDLAERLDDVGLGHSAAERDNLWSSDAPPDVLAERAADRCDVVWVVADRDRDTAWRLWHPNNVWWRFEPYRFAGTDTYRALTGVGFVVVDAEPVHHLQIVRLERAGPGEDAVERTGVPTG